LGGLNKLKEYTNRLRSVRASRIGVFAALYAATSFVPISPFIGASSFLSLNLIITPVIAILLPPSEALFASLFGAIGALYLAPFQAMFGLFTVLLPVAGSVCGSLLRHKTRVGTIITTIFLVLAVSAYLVKNYQFPYFVIPHSVALLIALITLKLKKLMPLKMKILLYAYVSTMCEQGMMMIFAVHLINLPWQAFIGILPLMIYERIIGTLGGCLTVLALMKAIPNFLTYDYQ